MLRETLKQEIDRLSEAQLRKIADFVDSIKTETTPVWQRATPIDRAEDFRAWIAQLPKTSITLTDEAFDRNSIYD
jgi:aspartate ammonia-lyase